MRRTFALANAGNHRQSGFLALSILSGDPGSPQYRATASARISPLASAFSHTPSGRQGVDGTEVSVSGSLSSVGVGSGVSGAAAGSGSGCCVVGSGSTGCSKSGAGFGPNDDVRPGGVAVVLVVLSESSWWASCRGSKVHCGRRGWCVAGHAPARHVRSCALLDQPYAETGCATGRGGDDRIWFRSPGEQ